MSTPEYKIVAAYQTLLEEYADLSSPKPNLDGIQRIHMQTKVGIKMRAAGFNISQDPILLKEAKRQNLEATVMGHAKQHRQHIQRQREMALGNEQGHGWGD